MKANEVGMANENSLPLPKWFDTFLIVANTSQEFNVSRVEDSANGMVMKSVYHDLITMSRRSLSQYANPQSVKDLTFEISIQSAKLTALAEDKMEKLSFFSRRENKEVKNIITFVTNHLIDAAVSMRRYEGVAPGSFEESELKKRNKLIV